MTTRRLTFPFVTRETGDDGVHSVTITTDDEDRMGDVIVPSGGRFANWQRAGSPVLFGHRHDQLPVGRGISLSLTANGIRMAFRFLEGDEFAARVENAWRQGALGASSIGFMPLAVSPLPSGRGVRIDEWDLVEASLTPTPANPGAVRMLKALGLAVDEDPDEIVLILDDDPDDEPLAMTHGELTAVIRREVAPLVQQVRALGAQRQWRDDDIAVRFHDSPDDEITFDPADLPQAIAGVLGDSVGTVVKRETRRALDQARGRITDD